MSAFAVAKIPPAIPKNAQAYEQLKHALLYARFRAGEVLSIRNLSELFGTSTMPVREAVSRLIAERALEALPNRGVRVPVLSDDQLRDLFRVRFALEGMAVELAADAVTPGELRELESFEALIERALRHNRLADAVRANIEFHLSLYHASRSETLVALIEALYLRYAPSLYRVFEGLPGSLARQSLLVHAQHSAIIEALRQRDRVRARRALEADLAIAVTPAMQASTPPKTRPQGQRRRAVAVGRP